MLRPMQIAIELDSRSKATLQQQIFDQLRVAILEGRLPPGMRLPSSRDLCAQLAASRNTVALAYERLHDEGYIETRKGIGTFVNLTLPEAALHSRRLGLRQSPSAPDPFSARYDGPFRGRRPTLFAANARAPLCDFRVGKPDPESFPCRVWRTLAARVLKRRIPPFMQYGDPAGLPVLRAAIVRHVAAARGIVVEPEQVFIVAGVQEALNLAARVFLAPGARVAMESPTYQGAAFCFESYGAALVPVPVDSNGLDVARMPRRAPTLAYVTPSHQFPLGYTLALERRLQLLEFAARTGTYILEDDYDGDFRYQGSPLSALQGLDTNQRVLYTTTFSKSMAAGLRLGYLIVPQHLVEPLATAKALLNNGHPLLDQIIMAEFIDSGEFDKHLRRIRVVYMARRDCLMEEIARNFGPCRFSGHEGGMHLAWHLPDSLPAAAEMQHMGRAAGVGLYTLSSGHAHVFADGDAADRILLLGYPSVPEALIRLGIRNLAATIARLRDGNFRRPAFPTAGAREALPVPRGNA
jgi:GntR family transcriptional regulator/MocR family aminotransferase